MLSQLRREAAVSARALQGVAANPALRRLELAWLGSTLGDFAYVVGLAVFAYRASGATAVALLVVARMLPAAAVAPLAAGLADRFPRRTVMLASDVARAGVFAVMALAAGGGQEWAVYALAVAGTVLSTAFTPAATALLPGLARTPAELTAANLVSSALETAGSFLGPALAAAVLVASGPPAVFGLNAASFVWSAVLVAGLPGPAPAEVDEPGGELADAGGLLAGFRAVGADRRLAAVVALCAAQAAVAGTLTVLPVVLALRVLDVGQAGVGVFDAAIGVGGLLGAAAGLALVAGRRLARGFAAGLLAYGLPLVLIGLHPGVATAVAAFVVNGLGNTLVDVSALTLLQRAVPDRIAGRVFGVLDALLVAATGLGALAVPLLLAAGPRAAFALAGAFLPLVLVPLWRPVREAEVPPAEPRVLALLRGIPMLAPLPEPALEALAAAAEPLRVPAGTVVVREGDRGDRFYAILTGTAAVSSGGRSGGSLGPGGSFGEIALLRATPRTATVTAESELELAALARRPFVDTVTGHGPSAAAAEAVVRARLGALRPV